MDRALGYELRGREFESLRARHIKEPKLSGFGFFVREILLIGKRGVLCYNAPFINLSTLAMSKKPNPQPQLTKDQTQAPDEPSVIARPLVRLLAILYDGMLILAMLFLVGAILSVVGTLLFLQVGTTSQEAQTLPLWYQNGIMTPAFVLTLVGFYGLFWRKSGQTLGMQTWRLKTVDSQGHFLTWGQSFRRIFSACLLPLLCATIGSVLYESRMSVQVSAFLGFLFNYLFCLVNRQGLAVHDILSNTMTLKVPKIQHESLWQTFKKRKQKA